MSQTGGYVYEPRAWWGDEDVQMMTYEVQGMYRRLLDHQWENGSIPTDPERLACILSFGPNHYTAESLAPLLAPLLAPFKPGCEDGSRLAQPRIAREREEWRSKQEMFKEAGKRGAAARAAKSKKTKGAKGGSSPPASPAASPPSVRKGKVSVSERKGTEEPREETSSPAPDGAKGGDSHADSIGDGGSRECDDRRNRRVERTAAEHVTPPATEPADPGGGGRNGPTDAAKIKTQLAELEALGVAGVAGLWAERLRCTVASKRPNRARQVKQLEKVVRGVLANRTADEARALLELAAERGWSGIEWRYLDEDGQGNGKSRWRGKSLPAAPNSSGAERGINV